MDHLGEQSFSPSDISLDDRLNVVRKAVRKATEEALKQVSLISGNEDLSGPQFKDPNASFNLGMELFGQDVQIVQQNIRDKLDQVERQLKEVSHEISHQILTSDDDDQENINSNVEDETAGKSKETLQMEANILGKKISFLRQCSLARSFLDESITLSKPGLSSDPDWILASDRLAKAEDALNEAQIVLTKGEKSNQHDSPALTAGFKIIDSILSSIRRERVDLIDRAKALFDACVTYTDQGISVRGSATGKHGLQGAFDVLEALSHDDTSSPLKDTMRRFVTELFRKVLKPVLISTAAISVEAETNSDGSVTFENIVWSFNERVVENEGTLQTGRFKIEGQTLCLEWTKDEEKLTIGKSSVMEKELKMLDNWKQALAFLHETMTFVQKNVLLERTNLCEQIGNQLFGKPSAMPSSLNLEALGIESCMIGGNDSGLVMENLVEAMASTCIPDKLKPDDLSILQSMADGLRNATQPFVQALAEMKFIAGEPGAEKYGTRLEAFSSNFEQKYIDNRRCTILNDARNLLLKNDYHNTVITGVDVNEKREKDKILRELDNGMDIFELHKSAISETAFKLMALCRQIMDETVEHAVAQKEQDNDSPLVTLAPTLYRAARETFDLFRAIIPACYGSEIASVPRTAAVFHNDCVYFQYHCQWLGLEYREKIPPVPKDSDDARATLFYQSFMFVDMVPLFRELADRSMGRMLDRQASQIVDIVGKRIGIFGQALRSDETLAEWSEAETALMAGLYHLRHLTETWKIVLSYDVFVRSIGHLADVLFTLYLDQVTNAPDISESACHFVGALFQKATTTLLELLRGDNSGSTVWNRFEAIGRFMDMTLMDIQTGLADGMFRSVTAPELSRLIKATFADGPKRQRLLQALASQ